MTSKRIVFTMENEEDFMVLAEKLGLDTLDVPTVNEALKLKVYELLGLERPLTRKEKHTLRYNLRPDVIARRERMIEKSKSAKEVLDEH